MINIFLEFGYFVLEAEQQRAQKAISTESAKTEMRVRVALKRPPTIGTERFPHSAFCPHGSSRMATF
jgi:hypothetical protein